MHLVKPMLTYLTVIIRQPIVLTKSWSELNKKVKLPNDYINCRVLLIVNGGPLFHVKAPLLCRGLGLGGRRAGY